MNIESIQKSGQPPGTPLRETAPPAPRQSAEASVRDIASETARAQQAQQARQAPPEKEKVEDALKLLSEFVSTIHPEISFSIDDETGTRVVKILDSESNKVIRQIPSEEAIQIAHALDKLQGLFVKDKA